MYVTTIMVIVMIGWCTYTLMVRGVHLPPFPRLSNLHYPTTRSVGFAIPRFLTQSG